MSKAFTRESDDAPEVPLRPRRASPLPAGVKNYLTSNGAANLREELNLLLQTERPGLLALPETDPAKSRLPAVNERIERIQDTLGSAVVVEAPPLPHDQVRFGATVTARNQRGEELRYRIVGVDETDLDRDWISWLSPIAKALLNERLGQTLRIKLPAGEEQLSIIAIRYE